VLYKFDAATQIGHGIPLKVACNLASADFSAYLLDVDILAEMRWYGSRFRGAVLNRGVNLASVPNHCNSYNSSADRALQPTFDFIYARGALASIQWRYGWRDWMLDGVFDQLVGHRLG
jgi:hypothetical protein